MNEKPPPQSPEALAKQELKKERAAHKRTQRTLAAERKHHIQLLLENALLTGKIAPHQRTRLANELHGKPLSKLNPLTPEKPTLKTHTIPKSYRTPIAPHNRQHHILQLANEYIHSRNLDPASPGSLQKAFTHLRRTHPHLMAD